MPDRKMASHRAKEGFDLWQEGRLEEAVERYREALTFADPEYFSTPEYHGELAHVLAALGRDDESRTQYEKYLDSLIKRPDPVNNLEVDVARYFLGQHLMKMRLPSEALAVVEPSLRRPHDPKDLLGALRVVYAQALWRLGRLDEARQAAQDAMSVELSERMRQTIRDELRDLLPD
jgi:Flp pilus assembly protein TadD